MELEQTRGLQAQNFASGATRFRYAGACRYLQTFAVTPTLPNAKSFYFAHLPVHIVSAYDCSVHLASVRGCDWPKVRLAVQK